MNKKSEKGLSVGGAPPKSMGSSMTSKTTKCHPKTLDIPVTTAASITSAKRMIFSNGNGCGDGANGLISSKGDKRSLVGSAIVANNKTATQSPRRGRGQQKQQQQQQQQQQAAKVSPVSVNSSSSSSTSSSAINSAQLSSICREVALIRDEHVAIRNTLSEKEGELGKTRVALRNIAEERDLLQNKVFELEHILQQSPQMYSHVAALLSTNNGGVVKSSSQNQNHPGIMSAMTASSPIPLAARLGYPNNINNNNNHSSIERQSSSASSATTAIIPNSNHIPREEGNCIRNTKGNSSVSAGAIGNAGLQQKLTISPSSRPDIVPFPSSSATGNGGMINSKHGGMDEIAQKVGNPVSLSSPPPNINSQGAHQAHYNSKRVEGNEQQYSKHSYKNPSHGHHGQEKMGQVLLSAPPFQQHELHNGNGRNNENGNDVLPTTVTGGNNNSNHFKNVSTSGGGGGIVGETRQYHHHLSQSGITGLDLMLLGPDCSTKVVEHLVHPWAIESSVREIEHRLVLKGAPMNGERVREVEIEIDRLNSRIDHLRSQNDVLTLNLEDAKSHADRLTVLLGKYESNNVALQLALRYSDQMTDAYEVLVALMETEMGQVLANLHARGQLNAICAPPSPSNNNTSGSQTSGVVAVSRSSGNNNNSNDNSPSEQVPPATAGGHTETKPSLDKEDSTIIPDKLSPSSPSSSGVSCSPSSKSMNLMEQAKRNRLVAERAARFLLSRFSPSSSVYFGAQHSPHLLFPPKANTNPFLPHHHHPSCQSGSTTSTTGSILSSSPSAASNLSNISGESGGHQDYATSPATEKQLQSTTITAEKDGGTPPSAPTEVSTTVMTMMTTNSSVGGSPTTTTSSTFRAASITSPFSPNGNEQAGDPSSVIPSLLPLLGTTSTTQNDCTGATGNGTAAPSDSPTSTSVEPLIRNLISTLKGERDGVKRTVITELESESLESLTPSPKPSSPYYNNGNCSNNTSPTVGGGNSTTASNSWSPAECRKLDLETAVLMQELMAMKEERAELRAQLFLLEKEKDSLELRVRSHESQEEAYMARINYLKSEIMDCKSLYSTPGLTLDTYQQPDNRNRNEILNSQQQHQHPNNGNNRNLETAIINNNNNNQNGNWEREALLKKRIHELATTLERVTMGSQVREKQNEEMINELNRANGILMQTLEVAKKKYQGRIKKMEDQILYVSERHATQMKLFGGMGSRVQVMGKYHG